MHALVGGSCRKSDRGIPRALFLAFQIHKLTEGSHLLSHICNYTSGSHSLWQKNVSFTTYHSHLGQETKHLSWVPQGCFLQQTTNARLLLEAVSEGQLTTCSSCGYSPYIPVFCLWSQQIRKCRLTLSDLESTEKLHRQQQVTLSEPHNKPVLHFLVQRNISTTKLSRFSTDSFSTCPKTFV